MDAGPRCPVSLHQCHGPGGEDTVRGTASRLGGWGVRGEPPGLPRRPVGGDEPRRSPDFLPLPKRGWGPELATVRTSAAVTAAVSGAAADAAATVEPEGFRIEAGDGRLRRALQAGLAIEPAAGTEQELKLRVAAAARVVVGMAIATARRSVPPLLLDGGRPQLRQVFVLRWRLVGRVRNHLRDDSRT